MKRIHAAVGLRILTGVLLGGLAVDTGPRAGEISRPAD